MTNGIIALIALGIFAKYYYNWRFKEFNERDEIVRKWEEYLKD